MVNQTLAGLVMMGLEEDPSYQFRRLTRYRDDHWGATGESEVVGVMESRGATPEEAVRGLLEKVKEKADARSAE